MVSIEQFIQSYNEDFFNAISSITIDFIKKLKNEINLARVNGKQVFILGNGGSAASSSHWVCDFSKNITFEHDKRLHIQSLVDNIPLGTALGNDISFNELFSEQLNNYMHPGDLVIALSVSGSSSNLVTGLKYAKENGALIFSIIGDYTGIMEEFSDYCEIINSKNYGIVEDTHMYIGHIISQILKQENAE